jgi:hypothetical protein
MARYTKEFKLTLTTANGIVAEEIIDLDELGFDYEEWQNLSLGEKEDVLDDYIETWMHDVAKGEYKELPDLSQPPIKSKYESTTLDYDVYGVDNLP